jgi:tetratricopeptide (TPR) repeat protein
MDVQGTGESGRLLGQFLGELTRPQVASVEFVATADRLRLRGKLEAAIYFCLRGLEHYPGYASGHAVLGDILRELGHLEMAESQWREALRLDAGHSRAHLGMAQLYLRQGEIAFAMDELTLARLFTLSSQTAKARLDRAQEQEQSERVSAQPSEIVATARKNPAVSAAALVNGHGLLVAGDLGQEASAAAARLLDRKSVV